MNQLELYNNDLQHFLLHGGDRDYDARIRAELAEFDRRVKLVLDLFEPGSARALCAMLRAIPDGNLDYMYTTWLAELEALGILDAGRAAELRGEHEKNPVAIRVIPDPESEHAGAGTGTRILSRVSTLAGEC